LVFAGPLRGRGGKGREWEGREGRRERKGEIEFPDSFLNNITTG